MPYDTVDVLNQNIVASDYHLLLLLFRGLVCIVALLFAVCCASLGLPFDGEVVLVELALLAFKFFGLRL
jgi:hypothetical protein